MVVVLVALVVLCLLSCCVGVGSSGVRFPGGLFCVCLLLSLDLCGSFDLA